MEQKTETQEIEVLKTQDLTNRASKVKYELPKYWGRDYINQRIEGCQNHQYKMLLVFLWYSGVRITEAVSLRKQGIDFENYVMELRWLKSRKYLTRNVPIHPQLRDVLQLYVATLKADDRVFPIKKNKRCLVSKSMNLN